MITNGLIATPERITTGAHTTYLDESIGTFMEALFLVKLTAQRKALLVDTATKLFAMHWAGAAGQEVVVSTQNSLDLLNPACSKWQANPLRAEALVAHATKLQAHVAALEDELVNPTEGQATSINTLNDASQYPMRPMISAGT